MGKAVIVIIILALIAFAVFGQYVGVRNTLVTKNEAVKASWSQVDIVLQRRADLIPNLVATVKGYRATGADCLRRYRQGSLRFALRRQSIGQDCRQRATGRRSGPLAGDRGKLSAVEVEREFPASAGRTGWHRKPHRGRAQALQRHAAGLQHLHPEISQQHLCRVGWIQTQRSLLRRVRGIAPGADGQFRSACSDSAGCASSCTTTRALAWKLILRLNSDATTRRWNFPGPPLTAALVITI